MKRRLIMGLIFVALLLLTVWSFSESRVEVHGPISSRDVAQIRSQIERLTGPAFFRKPSFANATRLPRDLRDGLSAQHIVIYANSENSVTVITSNQHDEMSLSLHKNSNGWSISAGDWGRGID